MMKIVICGHAEAFQLLGVRPRFFDVLMISSPDNYFAVVHSCEIPELARECKQLAFHDFCVPRKGYLSPTKKHVEEALAWAKGREEFIVTCQAGISRSSAMAYVIACSEMAPIEALSVLDRALHSPNMAIVAFGAELLAKPEMVGVVQEWRAAARDEGELG